MNCNRIVTAEFKAKEHKGPFEHTFSQGQHIVFCRYLGEDQSGVVFARIEDIQPAPSKEAAKKPTREYEIDRSVFESSTTAKASVHRPNH